MLKDFLEIWEKVGLSVKFSIILAGATKIIAFIAILYFSSEFLPRFFTENERVWLFVFFVCWILNSYAMVEVKSGFNRLRGK